MKLTTARNKNYRARRSCQAFTLAEVLAALLFLAIVIPAAIEAIHIASRAGLVAARKSGAARVAERILNESMVTGTWSSPQRGTVTEGTLDYEWSRSSQSWPQDAAMQLVTVEVKYTAQGQDYSVKLNTLARQQSQTPGLNLSQ
jgi:hypothetical protein